MQPPVIVGIPGVFEQPFSTGFSPQRGWYTIRVWRGTNSALRSLLPLLKNAGYEFQLDEGYGAIGTVRAQIPDRTDGSAEEVINLWELDNNSATKDILETDDSGINSISATHKRAIRAQIQSPDEDENSAQGSFSNPVAQQVYDLMMKGVREKVVYQQVLRHTQTVSTNYQVAASRTNVRRIISKASMANQENIPIWIYDSMDDGTSAQTGLAYGWYKEPPKITVVSYQRTQISQQWTFGLWSTLLYGALL